MCELFRSAEKNKRTAETSLSQQMVASPYIKLQWMSVRDHSVMSMRVYFISKRTARTDHSSVHECCTTKKSECFYYSYFFPNTSFRRTFFFNTWFFYLNFCLSQSILWINQNSVDFDFSNSPLTHTQRRLCLFPVSVSIITRMRRQRKKKKHSQKVRYRFKKSLWAHSFSLSLSLCIFLVQSVHFFCFFDGCCSYVARYFRS